MTTFDYLILALALGGLGTCYPFARNNMQFPCKDGNCILLSHTPYYRMFGVPNWWLGIGYYLLTIAAVLSQSAPLEKLAHVGAIVSVLMAIPLIYSLSRILQVICTACYLAHAINVFLLLAWVFAS